MNGHTQTSTAAQQQQQATETPICWLRQDTSAPHDYRPFPDFRHIMELREGYHRAGTHWTMASCRSALLEHAIIPCLPYMGRIHSALLLGVGSFLACDERASACRHKRLVQLAAFLDAVRQIQNHQGNRIAVRIQDPTMTQLDLDLLGTLGVEVVSEPSEGEHAVDHGTFVWAADDWDGEHRVLGHVQPELRPALYIGRSAGGLLANCEQLLNNVAAGSREDEAIRANMRALEGLRGAEIETHDECRGTEDQILCPVYNLSVHLRQ